MRIVAGRHRGRTLKTPQNSDIRPTSDKVRQALFNALHSRGAVVDAVVLDAFCGTGALGLEALSQGAESCAFMDVATTSLALAEENAKLLKEDSRSKFFQKDASSPGKRPEIVPAATLVFLDPPYHKALVPQAFTALLMERWLADDAIIVAETEKGADLSQIPAAILFEKIYGETVVTVFTL
jgi:16S rRNA (guanine966-N2)-methyltransferase